MSTGMIERVTAGLHWASMLGCGLIAGVFYAFSSFVMPALARLPAAHGVEAMQAINRAALQKPFLSVFLGTAIVCAVLALLSIGGWADPKVRYRLAGCALYLVGTFLVTMLFNVPRNVALDAVEAGSQPAAALWSAHLSQWTAWNHVRGAAALAGLVMLVLSR